jgi:hypothetical protein
MTTQRNWQHRAHKTKKNKAKTQHNNMCWTLKDGGLTAYMRNRAGVCCEALTGFHWGVAVDMSWLGGVLFGDLLT